MVADTVALISWAGEYEMGEKPFKKVIRHNGEACLIVSGTKTVDLQIEGQETPSPNIMQIRDTVAFLRRVEPKTNVWIDYRIWAKMSDRQKEPLMFEYQTIYLTDGNDS